MTTDLSTLILKLTDEKNVIKNTLDVPELSSYDSNSLYSVLTSLSSKRMIKFQKKEMIKWTLTKEGKEIIKNGESPEIKILKKVMKSGNKIAENELLKNSGTFDIIGQNKAFMNKWLKKEGNVFVTELKKVPEDEVFNLLLEIDKSQYLDQDSKLLELKKRKLIIQNKIAFYEIEKDIEFMLKVLDLETDIVSDMILTDSWENKKFKQYNFDSKGITPEAGYLHPLNKVREEFRKIFFSMGFSEMPTNQYVESCFWNFDALFVPQQHPARDLQDTFYLKQPCVAKKPDDINYWNNVKNVHEGGHYDSIGYRYSWKESEALRLVLRTHTTAISARMLYLLAKNPVPQRLFSIDRVFRNETVDTTHLAEFHQIEGLIAGFDITLNNLISFMKDFFTKIGVSNLKFKPTYNPYTEPSLEVYAFHNTLKKWIEIGNSGMFRPEMLEPMGLPKKMRVLGWGLSLERPTMIKYGISNIRNLLGYKVSLNFIKSNPEPRFDKDLI